MSDNDQSESATPQPQSLHELLEQLIAGYRVSQAIAVVAKLGVADLLAAEPKSVDELAAACGADASALHRLLRALTSVGLFADDLDGRWSTTSLGDLLRADAPASLRASAIMYGEPWSWEPWGSLLWSVQTGESAFRHVFGVGRFDYLTAHPEANAIYNAAMAGSISLEFQPLGAYDHSSIGTLVDVGGGHGSTLIALLRANPGLRGVLFDLPHVVDGAEARLAAADLADRCTIVAGDFFVAVPSGGDTYLLRHVLHNWDDRRAATILDHCRKAIQPSGRLLFEDRLIGADHAASDPTLLDLHMLVSHGGRERTADELHALLATAGFALQRVLPISGALCVVEAIPV